MYNSWIISPNSTNRLISDSECRNNNYRSNSSVSHHNHSSGHHRHHTAHRARLIEGEGRKKKSTTLRNKEKGRI